MTTSTYGDRTRYGVKDESLRYTWILYYIFIILTTYIGDISILVATTTFNVFKVHRFIVTIMQHVAVSDLAVCTFWVVPRMIALMTDQWILGDKLCRIQPYITYYFGTVCLLLSCLMVVCKLGILKFPFRSRYLKGKGTRSHQLCALVWAVSLIVPVIYLDRVDIFFDYRTYSCECTSYSYNTSFVLTATGTNLLAPIVIMDVCTVFILLRLLKARKAAQRRGSVQRRLEIVTTTFRALFYTGTVLPLTVYCFTLSLGDISDSSEGTFFQAHFYRFATSIILLNMLTNFFHNGLTVPRFRNFMSTMVNRITSLSLTSDAGMPQITFRWAL